MLIGKRALNQIFVYLFDHLSAFVFQCNELFTWKTVKLGVGVQMKLQSKALSGPPVKKFKVNDTDTKIP